MKITRKQLSKLINEAVLKEYGRGNNPYSWDKSANGTLLDRLGQDGFDDMAEYDIKNLNLEELSKKVEKIAYRFKTKSGLTYYVQFKFDAFSRADDLYGQAPFFHYIMDFVPVIDSGGGNQHAFDYEALTGENDLRVFETMVSIVRDFAAEADVLAINTHLPGEPLLIMYEPTTDKRGSVYSKLLMRNLPSYARSEPATNFTDTFGPDEVIITLPTRL